MKKSSFAFILALIVLLSCGYVFALTHTSISVDDVTVAKDEEIVVPIRISNNEGICGATLSIGYDDSLVLTQITKGEALSSLTMTKPGNLSANPFNLVFDGIEEDAADGVIAYLYFDAMPAAGAYDISVTYEEGDIVNGDLAPIEVEMINGQVNVAAAVGGGGTGGNEGEEDESHDDPVIKIGKAAAKAGESVDVPVYISGNTGICGATLKISYDASLTLTQITRGEALSSLTMTKPGDLSANPFNLVFDGIEEDATNGLFVTLTFDAPQEDGIYDITAAYEDGDIVNSDLLPVDVLIQNGSIAVGARDIVVTVGDKTITLPSISETNGSVLVAFYNDLGKMTSVKAFDLFSTEIIAGVDINASHAKVLCWSGYMTPLCNDEKIILK